MSYEVLESTVTYQGKVVTVTVDKLRMPDGSEAYRETVLRKKNAAAVLAVETDGRLLFVRQYRHPFREMLLEIPAGLIEEGESGRDAAIRELEEETGKKAGSMEFLCEMYPTTGFCSEKIQIFIAHALSQGIRRTDADEFVQIESYTLAEAMDMIARGEIKDGKTLTALFAWQARKQV